jgi:hypothetical protein
MPSLTASVTTSLPDVDLVLVVTAAADQRVVAGEPPRVSLPAPPVRRLLSAWPLPVKSPAPV